MQAAQGLHCSLLMPVHDGLGLRAGYHLLARMFGQVTYVSRSEYADRQAMFDTHVARVTDAAGPDSKVPLICS